MCLKFHRVSLHMFFFLFVGHCNFFARFVLLDRFVRSPRLKAILMLNRETLAVNKAVVAFKLMDRACALSPWRSKEIWNCHIPRATHVLMNVWEIIQI